MSNPNPSVITDEMWYFWLAFKMLEPSVELGGIYADKPGYHNTRDGNAPGDYSIVLPLDLLGPGDKAAAIDLTFPSAQAGDYSIISKYATRLLNSGRDPNDERGDYLREFYGQADNDSEVEGWDYQRVGSASSDNSHLWHLHLSFMRAYLKIAKAFRAVFSILSGETVEAWRAKEANSPNSPSPLPIGDSSMSTGSDVWGYPIPSPSLKYNGSAGEYLKYTVQNSRDIAALAVTVGGLDAKLDLLLARLSAGPVVVSPTREEILKLIEDAIEKVVNP